MTGDSQQPPSDPLGLAGQVVAEKYRIEHLVGAGGFAVVYRAEHTIWQKPVAIKFFNGLSSAPVELREQLQEDFIQEGALLTELSSQTAGIVQARDIGTLITENGQWMPYMVLEWLDGASLEDIIEQDRRSGLAWNEAEVVGFLLRVLPALEVAHARGIAHRDIKPANLFVMRSAARSRETPIKLLDFGVAKMVSEHAGPALAKTGSGINSFTPQYGAPEQFTRSYGATGPWTDVYALALVAVELMTNEPALQGDDLVQLGFASANPQLRPTPRARGAQISDALELVFGRALAVEAPQRFAGAGEFLEALLDAVGEPSGRLPLGSVPDVRIRPSVSSMPDDVHGATVIADGPIMTGGQVTGRQLVGGRAFDEAALSGATVLADAAPSAKPEPRAPSPSSSQPAVQRAVPAPPARRGGWLATLLAAVVAVGAITAVFAASDMDGAAETRRVLASAADTLKQKLGSASAPSAGLPAAAAPELGPPPGCPEGMVGLPEVRQGDDVLPAVCLDRHEVTAAEYQVCVDASECAPPRNQAQWPELSAKQAKSYSQLCSFKRKNQADFPINCVSWKMADMYCRANQKRLPTAAEWRRGAYGSPEVAPQRTYPWGEDAPDSQLVNACDPACEQWGKTNAVALKAIYPLTDGHPNLAPVGSFPEGASAFDLLDVAGNVAEWVQPESDGEDRAPALGGSWQSSTARELKSSSRASFGLKTLSPAIGFRCAKTP